MEHIKKIDQILELIDFFNIRVFTDVIVPLTRYYSDRAIMPILLEEKMQNYLNEFPSYDDELPVIKGFEDGSWHNDACPSLIRKIGEDTYLQLWCDYKNKKLSDFADLDGDRYRRYSLSVVNDEEGFHINLIASNNLNEVLEFINDNVNLYGFEYHG